MDLEKVLLQKIWWAKLVCSNLNQRVTTSSRSSSWRNHLNTKETTMTVKVILLKIFAWFLEADHWQIQLWSSRLYQFQLWSYGIVESRHLFHLSSQSNQTFSLLRLDLILTPFSASGELTAVASAKNLTKILPENFQKDFNLAKANSKQLDEEIADKKERAIHESLVIMKRVSF